MYLPDVTFSAAAAFVAGYDAASGGGLLVALREWLIPKLDGHNNHGWPNLVATLARRAGLTDEDDPARVAHLFSTLDEFLTTRDRRNGVREIYHEYEAWLQSQEWYGPSSPDWLPPTV